jgi:hypothetical protein
LPALTDLRFDWYPDVYFFLKTGVISVVMVAANAADQSCKEQQQMFDQVLCISNRTSSLLTPVLSTAASFCTVTPVLHDCNLCNLLDVVIPHLEGCNCRRLGHSLFCFSGHS